MATAGESPHVLGHDGRHPPVLERFRAEFERALPSGEKFGAVVLAADGSQPVEMFLHELRERHAPPAGGGLGAPDGLRADRKVELGLHT